MRSTNPIAALFGKSPIRPMQQHMGRVAECVNRLEALVEALEAGDGERMSALRDEIFALEHSADELKNEIRSHLPRSLMLPVDRRDLLDLLSAQDDIADAAQDVAGLLAVRRMTIPEPLRDRFRSFVAANVTSVTKCHEVVNELDELLASGFRGRSADRVLEMVDALARSESEVDALASELAISLFEIEETLDPVSVFFFYELLHLLGRIADQAENVGDRVRLLTAR
jgi:predicted phosphate transport protein (TIGR00153 family)